MAIVRPLILADGGKRSHAVLQVPNTGRHAVPGGMGWALPKPQTLITASATWTLSANKAALLPDSTTALDLANHAYMIYALEGQDQLYAVPQETWAAVSSGSNICPIAWVDSHHDLTPRLLSTPLVQYVWVQQADSPTIFIYTLDGNATGWTYTNTTYAFGPMLQVGTQVWFVNGSGGFGTAANSITRMNTDGTSAGPDISNADTLNANSLCLVGSQMWVSQSPANTIARFNPDGTSAGSPITLVGIFNIIQMIVVDNFVWANGYTAETGYSTSLIARLQFDGTLIDIFDPTHGSPGNEGGYIDLVNDEVWYVYGQSSGQGAIYRLHYDTTVAGATITDPGLIDLFGVVDLGGKAWVVNSYNAGAYLGNYGAVAVYDYSGTPIAGSPVTFPYREQGNSTIIHGWGDLIWTDNNGAGFNLIRTDLSFVRTSYPEYGHAASDTFARIRDMALVTVPTALPALVRVNAPPSGGSSGDGVNTLGLVGSGTTLIATTDVDIASTIWYLLIIDESNRIVGYFGNGTVFSVDVWQPAGSGGVVHTYQALLSDTGDMSGTLVAYTNTCTITWP